MYFALMGLCPARPYSYKNRGTVVDKVAWQHNSYFGWLTLFLTTTTLVCCALPIVLVSLGMGALMASLNYQITGLVFIAEHKYWTLFLSAMLLGFLAWLIWRPGQTCPSDPLLAKACQQSKRWNVRMFNMSLAIWSTGFFFSVLLLPLRQFFYG